MITNQSFYSLTAIKRPMDGWKTLWNTTTNVYMISKSTILHSNPEQISFFLGKGILWKLKFKILANIHFLGGGGGGGGSLQMLKSKSWPNFILGGGGILWKLKSKVLTNFHWGGGGGGGLDLQ